MNQKEVVKLAVIETNLNNMSAKLEEHIIEQKKDSVENKKDIERIIKKIDNFIKESDNKYARKEEVSEIRGDIISLKTSSRDWTQYAINIILSIIIIIISIYSVLHRGI